MGSYYIPPVNFGLVEDNLYRSGHPNELNFPFLEKLHLKKILYLSPETPPQAFMTFVQDQGIDLQLLGSAAEEARQVGIVVGCLRKLQRWNLTSIFEEYRRCAGSKVRVLNEQFIELFDTDLVTIDASRRPPWL